MAERPLDVLVVGGGVTGAATLLDAASRGLRAGLVERDDFACGTSSRSSKMIHGGLRYLASGDVGLVREALAERRSLRDRAPHLVRPLPMLLPIYGVGVPWQRVKIGAGLWMYDLLGAWRAGVRHTWYGVDRVTRLAPNLDVTGLVGALAYQDDQADDARLVITILRTAVEHGGLLANGARVDRLLRRSERVRGAHVITAEGDSLDIEAAVTVNAAGVWADALHATSGFDLDLSLVPAKGIHLTVPRDVAGVDVGVGFFGRTGSNLFIEPWQEDLALVGTTDTRYEGDLADPLPTEEDVDSVLSHVGVMLRRPIRREHVVAAWAGLRPLVRPSGVAGIGGLRTQDLSRSDRFEEESGLVTVLGGKLTTHRAMAEKAVDRAVGNAGLTATACHTHEIGLDGSMTAPTTSNIEVLAHDTGIDRAVCRHLLGRYGDRARDVVEPTLTDRDLLERIHPDRPYVWAEARFAVDHEMARTPEDVLARRTRIAIEAGDAPAGVEKRLEGLINDRDRAGAA